MSEEQQDVAQGPVGPEEAPVPMGVSPVPTTEPDTQQPPADPNAEVGPVVLFVDQNESYHADIASLVAIAEFAKAHGVSTIAPKRADGSIKWYGTPAELAREREAVLAVGVGYMPYIYAYGPKFGLQQVRDECAVLAEIMSVNNHCVCSDMEMEWNNEWTAATLFNDLMRPVPGLLYISCLADPINQGFPVRELAPCVNAWGPQDYDNWLAAQESQQVQTGMTMIQPALDLSQEFGPNNVVSLAAQMRGRHHKTIWLWMHAFAKGNPGLLDAVVQAFKG